MLSVAWRKCLWYVSKSLTVILEMPSDTLSAATHADSVRFELFTLIGSEKTKIKLFSSFCFLWASQLSKMCNVSEAAWVPEKLNVFILSQSCLHQGQPFLNSRNIDSLGCFQEFLKIIRTFLKLFFLLLTNNYITNNKMS